MPDNHTYNAPQETLLPDEDSSDSVPVLPSFVGVNRREAPKEPFFAELNSYNWLHDLPAARQNRIAQVQFKNFRRELFSNPSALTLKRGQYVVVERPGGVDIGLVALTGDLALRAYRPKLAPGGLPRPLNPDELSPILRIAHNADMELFRASKAREQETMIKSRQIAAALELNMKIGDVEYQADGRKAIFYYIADDRVDFRQLIKILAQEFAVRIEMKQIGARQEAGRIGGIGPCGRPLCCASWMRNFRSVTTTAARIQDLNHNPDSLTGQCSKLKCCTNFEADTYAEARRLLPARNITLSTQQSTYRLIKTDILPGRLTYAPERNSGLPTVTISKERAWEVIKLNKQDILPEALQEEAPVQPATPATPDLLVEDITRFELKKEKKKRKKKKSAPAAQQTDSAQNTGGGKQTQDAAPQSANPAPEKNNKRGENRKNTPQNRERANTENRPQRPAGPSAPNTKQSAAPKMDIATTPRGAGNPSDSRTEHNR